MPQSAQPQPSRATNLEELELILKRLFTQESRRRGLAFRPRPTDIVISPYAKCGTTWLQHIAHGLRTRGSMDFDEITTVTPWLEIAQSLNWDLEAPQLAQPRVYKSHLSWHDIPKGGRYICSFRNPADAFVSFYRFFEGYLFEPGSISMDDLFHWRNPRNKLAEQGYWYHLKSWWGQRSNRDVLLLFYEDMRADLTATIRTIARFMEIALDDELLEIVTRQSSREFMLKHKEKFSELPFRQHAHDLGILPLEVDAHKVTAGAPHEPRYQLSPALKRELEIIWQEQIYADLGFQTYDDLRANLKT